MLCSCNKLSTLYITASGSEEERKLIIVAGTKLEGEQHGYPNLAKSTRKHSIVGW